MTDDYDPLSSDLEAIERSIPLVPVGVGSLRQLLASLPPPLAPDVQSARAGSTDPSQQADVGAGGIASGLQGEPPGFASGGAIGVYPQLYFGLANLLRDPAFDLVVQGPPPSGYTTITTTESAIATDGSDDVGLDVWFAQQITSSSCTTKLTGRNLRSQPELSPFNSSAISLQLTPGASGTHELRVRSSTWDGVSAVGYPYLAAAIRVTTDVTNTLTSITSAVMTVELFDVTSSVVRATRTVSIMNMAAFDQSVQVTASAPYAGQSYEGHQFQARFRLVVVSTASAALQQFSIGEPQLVQGQIEAPPPFAPVLGSWYPNRIVHSISSTLGTTYPALASMLNGNAHPRIRIGAGLGSLAEAAIDFGGGAVSPDTQISRKGVGILRFSGINGTTDIAWEQAVVSAAPGSPAAGFVRLYVGTDKHFHQKDSSGVDTDLTLGAGGGGVSLGGLAGSVHIGTGGAVGVAGTAAESDHQHPAQVSLSAGGAGSNNYVARIRESGDTTYRLRIGIDASDNGEILWSSGGISTADIRLIRLTTGILFVDANGQANETRFLAEATSGQRGRIMIRVNGDTNPRIIIGGDATEISLLMGPGNAAQDIRLYRNAAGNAIYDSNGASATSNFLIEATSGQRSAVAVRVTGDSASRSVLWGDATVTGVELGPGNAARDLRIYRSAAKVLTIDDTAGGNVTLNVINAIQQNGTAVSVSGHGAADHANITRNVFLAAATAKLDAATAANIGASPDLTGVVALADAATQRALWTFEVPADWASGVITIQPVWSPGATDAVAHTVRWTMTCKAVAAGSTVTAAGTTTNFTGASAARTVGVVVYDTATSSGITPGAAGDLFRLEFGRIGADAADTYVGVVNLLGLIVTYTANQ